jgi:hypothetical protein
MSIPRAIARAISAIGVPPSAVPMDFAGWFEAYLGDHWYNNVPRIGLIPIGHGRGAADVIALTFGPNTLVSFKVWTDQVC